MRKKKTPQISEAKENSRMLLLLLLLLSLQSCPTLCDPIDGSPPGSSTPGILQARTLEWVAISFSNLCYDNGENKEQEQTTTLGRMVKGDL